MIIGMIPCRMGSQRLKRKNLRELDGEPLVERAINRCLLAGVFEQVWVNSEHPAFGEIALAKGVQFHQRPEEFSTHQATSEDYVYEFLKNHPCEYLVQVHSIAPLLSVDSIRRFVEHFVNGQNDVLLSAVYDQIECALNDQPVNFSYSQKTNSQELLPIQRITWSITGWKRETFLAAYEAGECATYAGQVGFFPLSFIEGHVIKTEQDLQIAKHLLEYLKKNEIEV